MEMTRVLTRFEVAMHEAGHVVVAYILGFQVQSSALLAHGGGETWLQPYEEELVRYRQHIHTYQRPEYYYFVDFLAFLAAGHEAFTMLTQRRDYVRQDTQDVREMAEYGKRMQQVFGGMALAYIDFGRERAREILAISANWHAVEAIAVALMEEDRLEHEVIHAKLDALGLQKHYAQKKSGAPVFPLP